MKRTTNFVLICASLVGMIWPPSVADARCNVACRAVVQEALVVTPYAVAVGVPYAATVAAYSPTTYSYSPTPPAPNVTVNVSLDRATLSAAMKDAITSLDQQQAQQPLPSPPPVPESRLKTNDPPREDLALPPAPPGYQWSKVPVDPAKQASGEQPPLPNASNTAPQPPLRHGELNNPQPTVSAVAANCFNCHSQNGNSPEKVRALAKIDLTAPLSPEQRLLASRDVLSTKMPHGKKLNAEEAGAVLEELVGK